VASGAAVVVMVGLVLFAASGVWPPLVAVESGSMNPHMQKGDLVFVMEAGRLAPDTAREPGVVTSAVGRETDYRTFGGDGNVIVYRPNGNDEVPIIHRAHFWVEEGENWYDRADVRYLAADNCAELIYCPAPHAGFITRGDANSRYDQTRTMGFEPVRPAWVKGKAVVRIPYLGWVRLAVSGQV
jgi:signal peptidase